MGRPKAYETEEEKLSARRETKQRCATSRISIGDQIRRWNALKGELQVSSGSQLAKLLLDSYFSRRAETQDDVQAKADPSERDSSPVSYAGSGSAGQKRNRTHHPLLDTADENLINEPPMKKGRMDSSFEEESSCEVSMDPADKSYNPSNESIIEFQEEMHANSWMYHMDEDELQEISDEDLVHDIGHKEFKMDDEETNTPIDDATPLRPEPLVLSNVSCILDLANSMSIMCTKCSQICTLKERRVGTNLLLTWSCAKNHQVKKWSSQHRFGKRGVYSADFFLAASILLSGNNYAKIALLMKFIGLKPMPRSFFFRVQSRYTAPVIKSFWNGILEETRAKYKGKEVVSSSDGRNDSPGHSSEFCTYTAMVEDTHDIIDMVTVDKRQVGLKSPNMEPFALRKVLANLEDAGLIVKEVVTDAHSQIPPILREKNIVHQWDIWHGAKNLSKKLNQLASTKGCEDLKPWIHDITTHFWKVAETAEGDMQRFKENMLGTLHHIVDEHEWVLGACNHGPLSDEDRKGKQWLDKNSPAMEGLRRLIGNPTWLRQSAEHYCNFRHTGEVEVLHHHMLMYASKRQSFSPPIYEARMQLAGIDYHMHKDREYKRDKDGKLMFDRIYNKRSSFWYPTPLKVPKTYYYMGDILEAVAKAYKSSPEKMLMKVILDEADPRRIQKNLAPIPPPPTSTLVKSHQSRMKGKVKWNSLTKKE